MAAQVVQQVQLVGVLEATQAEREKVKYVPGVDDLDVSQQGQVTQGSEDVVRQHHQVLTGQRVHTDHRFQNLVPAPVLKLGQQLSGKVLQHSVLCEWNPLPSLCRRVEGGSPLHEAGVQRFQQRAPSVLNAHDVRPRRVEALGAVRSKLPQP